MEVTNFKEVDFYEYCRSCEYSELEEWDDPCDICLESPCNINSKKPVNWKEKEK